QRFIFLLPMNSNSYQDFSTMNYSGFESIESKLNGYNVRRNCLVDIHLEAIYMLELPEASVMADLLKSTVCGREIAA
ncbi:hypothetical protein, partial [Acidaminobacter sp.]|uniref:hypothetical protein n=1 Tax=Acidaminobacter sp. TaxID=1872102 RepID=UPI0025B99C2C